MLPGDAPSSLAVLLLAIPESMRARVSEIYLRVYRQLVSMQWPVSYGRTNVTPLNAESTGLNTMSVTLA